MRRIIERVVTVVTTTTWKISWEADPSPSHPSTLLRASPTTDPVSEDLPPLKILPESTSPSPTLVEPKEVDLPEEKENAPDQT